MSARHRLGPHRDPAVDQAVLEAARSLLVERGYGAASIDAIATRAGVSRPAIYRRWPSKAHLIAQAVFPDVDTDEVAGDITAEIRKVIRGTIQLFGAPAAREAMPGLMSDMRADSSLYHKLSARLDTPTRRELAEYLRSDDAAGSPDSASNTLLDTIAGAALFAMCIRNIDDLDGFAESLENLLLYGLAGDPVTRGRQPSGAGSSDQSHTIAATRR
ncbi:helix-turn-helix domain-containing protein [Nocardia sp. NPDC049220]|uniref:TetR/AcrR family transcriptional regulator n=1 Tax=Nocardia sp. NPDC049220 TaxID=3155273 RepID=UPI0033D2DA4C